MVDRSRTRTARPKSSSRRPTARSLPSTIEICLHEKITPDRARRLVRDRKFFSELREQALHDLEKFPYVDTLDCAEPLDPNDFILYPSTEINPLRLEGKCSCSPCLVRYTDDFARGVCLYSDVVVLPDTFSQSILRTPPGEWGAMDLMAWVSILAKLEPLMRSGVIRFSRWAYSRCSACGEVGKNAAERVASRLLSDVFA
jgi:hypothetical protein